MRVTETQLRKMIRHVLVEQKSGESYYVFFNKHPVLSDDGSYEILCAVYDSGWHRPDKDSFERQQKLGTDMPFLSNVGNTSKLGRDLKKKNMHQRVFGTNLYHEITHALDKKYYDFDSLEVPSFRRKHPDFAKKIVSFLQTKCEVPQNYDFDAHSKSLDTYYGQCLSPTALMYPIVIKLSPLEAQDAETAKVMYRDCVTTVETLLEGVSAETAVVEL